MIQRDGDDEKVDASTRLKDLLDQAVANKGSSDDAQRTRCKEAITLIKSNVKLKGKYKKIDQALLIEQLTELSMGVTKKAKKKKTRKKTKKDKKRDKKNKREADEAKTNEVGIVDANDYTKLKQGSRPLVYMDVDLNGDRAAYVRAKEFVDTNSLRYGLSSNELTELGGSEKANLSSLYEANFEWSKKGRMATSLPPQRIVISVFDDLCPLTTKNFLGLVTGEKGKSGQSGKPLHYVGAPFHRVIPGFVAQAGDFVMRNGTGGESIYGKKFKDEKAGLKLKFDKRGIVGMCNTGKNSNSSQFFFGLDAIPKLNGKHVIFGELVSGFEVLDMIEKLGQKDDNGKPTQPILIVECGVVL